MKLFHVQTKYEGDIKLPKKLLDQLPPTLMLMGTVQFREQMPNIKKQLEDSGRKVELFRGVHDVAAGQILGCDIFHSPKEFDAFLYIGDGLFHPTALLYDNQKVVFYHDPFSEKTIKLTQKDLEKVNNHRKASLSKFFMVERIGVLVTTKPGQCNMSGALELKKRLEKEGKKCFVFLAETLDMGQLENFPFVQCWVNTACPRIVEDTRIPMINLWDLRETVMKGFGVRVV